MPPPDRDDLDERELRAIRSLGPQGAADQGSAVSPVEVELTRLGDIVRSLSDEDVARDEPPIEVWAGIAARVRDTRPGPPTLAAEPAPAAGAVPLHRASRRSAMRPWGLAVAAAAAAVLVVVALAVTRGGGDDSVVVASARLEPLPDQPTGQAEPVEARVVEADDGLRLDLSLADSGLPAPSGFYEVWLIDTNVEGMVSLGPARPDGTYAVPSDIDVAAFPIVDVSVEPPDGNPTHSGVSVLRGTLA